MPGLAESRVALESHSFVQSTSIKHLLCARPRTSSLRSSVAGEGSAGGTGSRLTPGVKNTREHFPNLENQQTHVSTVQGASVPVVPLNPQRSPVRGGLFCR